MGGDRLHHLIACEQDERAPAGRVEEVLHKRRERLGIRRRVGRRVGQAVGREHRRLTEVVERTLGGKHLEAFAAAETPGHVGKAVADAKRGGRQHDGILHVVEHAVKVFGHGKRRGDKAYVGRTFFDMHALDPVGVGVLFAAYGEVGLVRKGYKALRDAGDLRGEIGAIVHLALGRGTLQRVAQVVEKVHERGELRLETRLHGKKALLVPGVRRIRLEESVKRVLAHRRARFIRDHAVANAPALLRRAQKPFGHIRQLVRRVYDSHDERRRVFEKVSHAVCDGARAENTLLQLALYR